MRIAPIAIFIFGLSTMPAGLADELSDLEDARGRWDAIGSDDYVFSYRRACDCYRDGPPLTTVYVEGGSIVRVVHRRGDAERETPAGDADVYWTIDDLFDKLAGAIETGAEVRAEYAADGGYPTSLYVDYDPAFAGDEMELNDIELVGTAVGRR